LMTLSSASGTTLVPNAVMPSGGVA
jgi:hypothetical protein